MEKITRHIGTRFRLSKYNRPVHCVIGTEIASRTDNSGWCSIRLMCYIVLGAWKYPWEIFGDVKGFHVSCAGIFNHFRDLSIIIMSHKEMEVYLKKIKLSLVKSPLNNEFQTVICFPKWFFIRMYVRANSISIENSEASSHCVFKPPMMVSMNLSRTCLKYNVLLDVSSRPIQHLLISHQAGNFCWEPSHSIFFSRWYFI